MIQFYIIIPLYYSTIVLSRTAAHKIQKKKEKEKKYRGKLCNGCRGKICNGCFNNSFFTLRWLYMCVWKRAHPTHWEGGVCQGILLHWRCLWYRRKVKESTHSRLVECVHLSQEQAKIRYDLRTEMVYIYIYIYVG